MSLHTHSLSIEDIRPNKIGMWNMSSQMEKSVEVASTTAAGVITTTTDHDFSVGDFVTYVHSGDSSEQIIGLGLEERIVLVQQTLTLEHFH